MSTRPFQSIAAKNRVTWSPSAKDLANHLSAHLEAEWCREESLAGFVQLEQEGKNEE